MVKALLDWLKGPHLEDVDLIVYSATMRLNGNTVRIMVVNVRI